MIKIPVASAKQAAQSNKTLITVKAKRHSSSTSRPLTKGNSMTSENIHSDQDEEESKIATSDQLLDDQLSDKRDAEDEALELSDKEGLDLDEEDDDDKDKDKSHIKLGQASDKQATATVTLTATKERLMLGKRTRTKWERRWVLVPNVLDLNKGEIWVQKWVTSESAQSSKETIEKIKSEVEIAEKQEAIA